MDVAEKTKVGFFSGPDYFNLPVGDKTWILQNVLPVGGMVNIYGKPKTGKSMIGLQLASAIASGKSEWLSFGIATHGPVAYLQVDTPRSLWVERVKHLQKYGVDFSKVFFTDTQECPYPFDILGSGYVWLKEQIELMEEKPVVLFIDTLREIHAGSEDESAQMKNVITQIQSAVMGSQTAVVLISHSRKGNPQNFGMQADLMDENRGSGYVAGKMDCVLWLREKALSAKGRALAETEIAVEMDPNSFEIKVGDRFVLEAIDMVEQGKKLGISSDSLIASLNSRYPKKSFEQCRGVIQRIFPATV